MSDAAKDYGFSHLITPKERKGIIKRAKERALQKVEEREHLRLEIEARACIHHIMAIQNTMIRGYEPSLENPDLLIPIDPTRTAHFRVALQAAEILLKKVLPDLKQVEIQGDRDADGNYVFEVNTGIIRSSDKVMPWD